MSVDVPMTKFNMYFNLDPDSNPESLPLVVLHPWHGRHHLGVVLTYTFEMSNN